MPKKLAIAICLLLQSSLFAQKIQYTTANAHSHNNYEQPVIFWEAYNQQFGSIEADIYLSSDSAELWVAHQQRDIASTKRTLDSLYLRPLQTCIQKNKGYVYADQSRSLQLMIDIKTAAVPTLNKLISVLRKYPELINNPSLKIVISGNRPDPSTYTSWPSFILFDGNIDIQYSEASLSRIAMISEPLTKYSKWNGKGRLTGEEEIIVQGVVKKSHALKKPLRFWAVPDSINTWYALMKLQVDYINTDRINELALFLKSLPSGTATARNHHVAYQPNYKTDGSSKPPKNIILLIGDGTGLAQLYAGYTGNKGSLSIFSMKNIGLSKTSSYDNYITDSAPGSTAFSSGVKTNNRYVGVDHTGARLKLLPEIFIEKGILSGIVTSGDITDATPADFYAHRGARDSSVAIFHDLAVSPVHVAMGAGNKFYNEEIKSILSKHYVVTNSIKDQPSNSQSKWIVIDSLAGLSILDGRGPWLENAFQKATEILSKNKAGFFLMTEGAQIDYGGHFNKLPYIVEEAIDFDAVVTKALQFADKNGETLVIVTADHETGGLTLLDGDYNEGYVGGQFSTNDHTAIPVPVFAYGPGSQLFRGVYENTEIFFKILTALGLKGDTQK